jgi:uncharacterized protein
VKVAVKFPTDTPIASVLVAPHPGWTSTVQTVQLSTPIATDDGPIDQAVSEVTWTAGAGQGIAPGQFGEFDVIAGLLPKVSALSFPTVQTYSNGTAVSWIEVAAPGSTTEPDHPAPSLNLVGTAAVQTGKAKASSSTGATVLAVIALVVAAAALGLAVVSRARVRGSAES